MWSGTANMAIPPNPPNRAMMLNFPMSTCTCRATMDQNSLCILDRRDHWDVLRPQLLATRTANKEFLRTSALDPASGTLWTAAPARLEARWESRDGHFVRGCRCGREVTPARHPKAYQCMACQGIIHVTPVGPLPAITNPSLLLNSATAPAMFVLPRGRNAATI